MMKHGTSNGVRALMKGDRGAVTMIFAVFASVMIGAMCMAYDAIHTEMTQARLQMASDVASLSAGANLAHYDMTKASDVAQWKADAYAYYGVNMPDNYMQLDVPRSDLSIDVTGTPATGQKITFSVKGSIPLIAPIFLKQPSQNGGDAGGATTTPDTATVTASNTVLRQPKSTLELVMVLDNTGSMSDYASTDHTQGSKIQGLRKAASGLLTSLFAQTTNDSYVGLVPFTTMVNVKNALSASGKWMTPRFAYNGKNVSMTPNKDYPGSGWGGCAVEPHDGAGNVAAAAYAPASSPGFTPFYYNVPPGGFTLSNYTKTRTYNTTVCTLKSTRTVTGVPLTRQNDGSATYCGGDGAQITDWWGQPDGSTSATTTLDQNGNTNGGANGPCAIQPALFLTQNSSALQTAVSNMQANGSTIIPSGLLWGWRMLSSDWSNDVSKGNGWISADTSLPRLETTQALQRVVIVLTDGENDPGSASGIMPAPSFNGISGVGSSALHAPTVPKTGGGMLTSGSMTSVSDINDFQLSVCKAMKDSGIVIYAITFGTYGTDSASVAAQSTMQSCANPGNYYHAPDNSTLNSIFQQIAGNLGVLRLTQ